MGEQGYEQLQVERNRLAFDQASFIATIKELQGEVERLREALTIENEDARKLAIRLEGESNLVAELSRRLAALEAKP
jgi:hypothetical protein